MAVKVKSTQTSTELPGESVAKEPIDPADCLLAAIREVIGHGKQASIEVSESGGKIWIDPEAGQYWQQVGDPESFFATPSRLASVQRVPVPRGYHASGPLEELLWDAAFMGSGGRLFKNNQLHDLVELNWWPNLTRIAHTQSTYAFCAFLSRRPSSMHLTYRVLHVPEDEACRFYNAALVSGCLKVLRSRSGTAASLSSVRSEEDDDAHQESRNVEPFWRRLFSKVSGL